MVPSQKIRSHAEHPEMSAAAVTEEIMTDLVNGVSQYTLVNYANPDMVGHTGDLAAAIKAMEFLDTQVKKVVDKVLAMKGQVIITADHGNCEEMIDLKTKEMLRKHTTNPVPLTIISNDPKIKSLKLNEGALGSVSPTVLKLMGFDSPSEMSSPPLF